MAIVFCDMTAVEIYRANRFRSFNAPIQARAAKKMFMDSSNGVSAKEVDKIDLGRYGVQSEARCIHLLVSSASLKRNLGSTCFHVWQQEVTTGMFIELEPDVYIVSPEFLVLQVAGMMNVPLLAELGMELCGRYEVAPYYRMERRRPRPLTSPAKIERFLDAHTRDYGARKAKQALVHVLANSWSSMETKVCLLLCLPRTMGGYGIRQPLMNDSITLPTYAQVVDGRSKLYIDMHWPDEGFAVEYDGEDSHFNATGIIRDNRRLTALSVIGIDVMVLTYADVFYYDAMDNVAKKIARRLGIKQRKPSRKMLEQRVNLRKMLLFGEGRRAQS